MLQDGVIYEAYLRIAKASDGRNILYSVNLDINNGIAVDMGATNKRAAVIAAMPLSFRVSQNTKNVKQNLSPNSEGFTENDEDQYSLLTQTDYTEDDTIEDIFYDIKAYYERGRVPTTSGINVSWYSQFAYSLPIEEQYDNSVKSNNETEMQRLVDIAAEAAMPDSVVRIRI